MNEQDYLAAGLERLGLPLIPERLQSLLDFLDFLDRWNRIHNLTAIRNRREALEKHLLDSLTPLPFLPKACRLLDFGSGAGLPGLVLKLYRPDLELCSLEPVAKKAVFQRQAVRRFGLDRTAVHICRLEEFADRPEERQGYDRIIFRAVGAPERYAAAADSLLAPQGLLIAMKGAIEEWDPCSVLPESGLSAWKKNDLALPFSGAKRSLLVWKKA